MQQWIMSNPTRFLAVVALACALGVGLFTTLAQVRCTLLEEDVARLKGSLMEEIQALRAEQEVNNNGVLRVVTETARHVADQKEEETSETPETPVSELPKDEPEGDVE